MSIFNDPERLEALARSGLLDKNMHERIDHLTFAACRLLLADVAQINALDGTLQHTISGYPPRDWPSGPLENFGCREVLLSGKPLVVSDTVEHPVTCDMPWNKLMRGYLSVPVCYRNDRIIGAICVLTSQPRDWKSYEIQALFGVARLVAMSLNDPE